MMVWVVGGEITQPSSIRLSTLPPPHPHPLAGRRRPGRGDGRPDARARLARHRRRRAPRRHRPPDKRPPLGVAPGQGLLLHRPRSRPWAGPPRHGERRLAAGLRLPARGRRVPDRCEEEWSDRALFVGPLSHPPARLPAAVASPTQFIYMAFDPLSGAVFAGERGGEGGLRMRACISSHPCPLLPPQATTARPAASLRSSGAERRSSRRAAWQRQGTASTAARSPSCRRAPGSAAPTSLSGRTRRPSCRCGECCSLPRFNGSSEPSPPLPHRRCSPCPTSASCTRTRSRGCRCARPPYRRHRLLPAAWPHPRPLLSAGLWARRRPGGHVPRSRRRRVHCHAPAPVAAPRDALPALVRGAQCLARWGASLTPEGLVERQFSESDQVADVGRVG